MKRFMLVCLVVLTLPSIALAQDGRPFTSENRDNLALGGGYFIPASNSGGVYVYAGYYYEVSPGFFFGGNLEYYPSESTIFGVDKVRTTSVGLATQIKYLLVAGDISPYIGATLGYSYKKFDEGDIRGRRPEIIVVSSTGQGVTVGALGGLMGKLSGNVLAVGEVRYTGEFVRTELAGKQEFPNVGGLYLSLGLQIAL